MAISLISGGTQNAAAANGGNVTLTLPTLQEGDVVYVYAGRANGGPAMSTSGYTQVGADATNGTHVTRCFRKVMGATPDTSAVVTGGGNAATATSAVCVCLRGVNSTPEDATPTTANGSSTNPRPPSITTVTNGAWVLAFASSRVNDTAITAVSGYSNMLSASATDTDPSSAARCTLVKTTAGAENPAAYTGWATGTWGAITVAVRPAAEPAASTLTDTFNDGTLDSAKWSVSGATAQRTATESGGDLRLSWGSDTTTGALRVLAQGGFSLIGDRVYARVADWAGTTGGTFHSTEFGIRFNLDQNFLYYWLIEGGQVWVRHATDGGDGTDVMTPITYTSDHQWLSIREASGSVIFETAPDGASGLPGTWTQRHSETPGFDMAQVKPYMGLVVWDGTPLPEVSPALFDGFNTNALEVTTHATSGALTGPGSTVAGAAARTRAHDTAGALPGLDASVAGAAERTTPGGAVTHATTGVLAGPGAAVAGTAARLRAFTSSGALTGSGATVAGAAARTRVHGTTGVTVGPGATVTGAARRLALHTAAGALAGPGAVVAGSASSTTSRPSTGALVGSGAVLAGSAARAQTLVTHSTSGVLAPSVVNPAILSGVASRTINPNKTASVQDTFDGASLDTAKWDVLTVGGATGGVSLSGSMLEINQTNNAIGSGFMVRTDNTKDFAGSYAYTKLASGMIASNGQNGAEANFGVLADADSGYLWQQRSNGTLVPHWKVAGTPNDGPEFSYTPSTHAWLRLKEVAGTVYWQHAPSTADDPPLESQWVTDHTRLRAADGTFAINAMRVRFMTLMAFGTPGVPTGPVRFDCVNIRTKSVVSHAASGAMTGPGATVAGAAARRVTHAASGVLAGSGPIIVGAAARSFEHTATGALPGGSAIITANGSTSDVTRKIWVDVQDTAGAWSDKPQSADPWTQVPESGGTWGS